MGDVDDRRLDLEKEDRVKARWAMLRNALIKKKNLGNGGGADDDVILSSSSNYSINAFPGFNLLTRTIFNSTGDDCDTPSQAPVTNHDHHEYHLIQNSYTPSNNTSNSRPISFITRETTIIDPYSHIKYNGIDNTGNVRVWDAESTLAAFLLSIILDDDQDIVELLKVKINESCANEQKQQSIAHLRKDIRSMIMTRPRSSLLRNSNNNSNNNKSPQSSLSDDACNILELGAGQAGLVALAIANIAHLYNSLDTIKSLCIVITDGHPTCVANNKVCARLVSSISSSNNNKSSSSSCGSRVSLQVELLCWDSSIDVGVEACIRINKLVDNENWITTTNNTTTTNNVKNKEEEEQQQRPVYHLVLASDCTHFTNYHDGLLLTIARTLVVGGVALLCQPHRGSTLDEFMALITVVNNTNNNIGTEPLFRLTLYEEFHTKITSMHKSLMLDKEDGSSKSNIDNEDDTTSAKSLVARSYDPNRHLPLLLVLIKLRPYDETIDGDIVRGYHNNVKMRS